MHAGTAFFFGGVGEGSMYADTRCITPHRITFQQANMLTVAGANHIITMDLHASQVSSVV